MEDDRWRCGGIELDLTLDDYQSSSKNVTKKSQKMSVLCNTAVQGLAWG